METLDPRLAAGRVELDLSHATVRDVNRFLHHEAAARGVRHVEIAHPDGKHNIAVGLDADIEVDIRGHVGYYAAGMNERARVTIHGSAGRGVAENIMSGVVRVRGNASDCAAASGHGGLVAIEGDAASRLGISLKGSDVVVRGNVGHASGFMAQVGRIVVCGDAAAGLGDSLYEAVIYVRGKIHGLGADARLEPMTADDYRQVEELLAAAGFDISSSGFQRVASARTLYHWNSDHAAHYG